MSDTANDKLRAAMREIFQLDRGDLDFGIYRILNVKKAEIQGFIDNDLLPQAREILEEQQKNERARLESELNLTKKAAKHAGVDVSASPNARKLEARLATMDKGVAKRQEQVYADLRNFFLRYYKEGDFLSLRRYKKDVYALPYEGEEVKLHWANADQYYVKSSENFERYAFETASGKVTFRIDRAETATDNNKANGKNLRYLLRERDPVVADKDGLTVWLEYRSHTSADRQEKINKEKTIPDLSQQAPAAWRRALSEPAPTESNKDRTLLLKHLNAFTAKNTFDYFIHKNLRGFLRRELDFYVKNEVVHLDDLDDSDAAMTAEILSRARATRRLGRKIINMLAQLENFQKRLWLKKKFVLQTEYLVSLGALAERGGDGLLADILRNKDQAEEWKDLYDVKIPRAGEARVNFLHDHPTLLVDTARFDAAFKWRLLSLFDDIDGDCDGVLLHGDNFHALNLLTETYRERVQCVYIDPPYNTSASEILYKNDYKHSSWLTMLDNRLTVGKNFLTESGFQVITIDYAEFYRLGILANSIFGEANQVGIVTVFINPKGRQHERFFSSCTEYMLVYAKNAGIGKFNNTTITYEKSKEFQYTDDKKRRYRLDPFARIRNSTTEEMKPNFCYPIYVSKDLSVLTLQETKGYYQIYPEDERGEKFSWKVISETFERNNSEGTYVAEWNEQKNRPEIKNKYYENEPFPNLWKDKKYYPEFKGGNQLLEALFGKRDFLYPKSVYAVSDIVKITGGSDGYVLDYFAGSGTTAHAVINLNREDGGRRKFILAEMGDYFDNVLLKRIKKVAYSPEWKDGKPARRATEEEAKRSPRLLKYQWLESYEDALDNIAFREREGPLNLGKRAKESARESYHLRYFLNMETRDSATLLDVDKMRDPFSYALQITRDGKTERRTADLTETFNYLLGLRVKTMAADGGVWTVEGENREGQKILVLWRDVDQMDAKKLNEWFEKTRPSPGDREYDIIYVNGDNLLENLRGEDESWKARLIETEFRRRMFEDTD